MKKRVLSLFMTFVLCLTLLPTAALAVADTADAQNTRMAEATPQGADIAVNSTYANGKDIVVQNGILNGIGDNLVAPKNSAGRAQVTAMMARYLKNVG